MLLRNEMEGVINWLESCSGGVNKWNHIQLKNFQLNVMLLLILLLIYPVFLIQNHWHRGVHEVAHVIPPRIY